MATTKIDGIHLRLYEEIRAHCERFFRKTLPVFKEIERFRMEVEEESDRYLVFFYEQSEPPDPYREECGMGMIVFKKGYKVALLRRGVPHPAGRPSRGMHKFNQIGA
jgi:hypothetical protein